LYADSIPALYTLVELRQGSYITIGSLILFISISVPAETRTGLVLLLAGSISALYMLVELRYGN